MKLQYVEITFKNTDSKVTKRIIDSLKAGGTFGHVSHEAGCIVGNIPKEANVASFKNVASETVQRFNDDWYCHIRTLCEEQVAHLL